MSCNAILFKQTMIFVNDMKHFKLVVSQIYRKMQASEEQVMHNILRLIISHLRA